MPAKTILKSKKINEIDIVTIKAGWIDTSFDHDFGRKVQGFYEVTDVILNGMLLPLDILDSKFLEEMDDLCNT